MMPTRARTKRSAAPRRITDPTTPRRRAATAMPLLVGGRLPASIADSSLVPITQATGANMPMSAMPRMPKAKANAALLCSGWALGAAGKFAVITRSKLSGELDWLGSLVHVDPSIHPM